MNLAILTGRLTKIPSITATNDYTIARFTLQTGSYEKDGRKIYTTDVVIDTVEFAESKKKEQKEEPEDDFVNVPEGIDEEFPFA